MRHLIVVFISLTLIFSCNTSRKNTDKLERGIPKRPNILFIMSDDHAYQAISAYQDHLIQTPNIDRIAHEGMLFTNACVSNSICAPSRAAILTGKHSHINGKIDNMLPFDTTQVTFPQVFQKNGYQTAMFGKLHFGNNPKGFDQFKILPGQGSYYNPNFITKDEGKVRVKGYVTDIITDMTLDWLKTERNEEDPFLLFYLHKAPHREWLPAERHYKEYIGKTFPEPKTLFDNYSGRGKAAKEAEMNLLRHMNWSGDSKLPPQVSEALGLESNETWADRKYKGMLGRMDSMQRASWDAAYQPMIEDFKKTYPSMTEEEQMRWKYNRYMQDYLACIEAVDEGVGKVLDYLEDNGLAENTIVVYTSDQGFYLGEHGWFDKRFIYNESFKTPLLIKWPDQIESNSVTTEMVQNIDFAPTFMDAAGISIAEDIQGESIMPLLQGNSDDWDRESVYYHYYEYPAVHAVRKHYGIVNEDYKLVKFYGDDIDEWELYDRKKDTMELTNVYHDPQYTEIVKKLKVELTELRNKYRDSDELDKAYDEKRAVFRKKREEKKKKNVSIEKH